MVTPARIKCNSCSRNIKRNRRRVNGEEWFCDRCHKRLTRGRNRFNVANLGLRRDGVTGREALRLNTVDAEAIAAVSPELVAKIDRKQKERQAHFIKLKEKHILNEKAKSIVELPVLELVRKLQSRELLAREVLEAFIAKALEVNEKFNCITEFTLQSLEWASALDNEPNTTVRPLRGLPVAIKDDHDVEGMDSTMGFAKNLYKPAAESAVLVKILLKLGAVPFCKTNLPQSIFSCGSDNPIFGTTLNALNVQLAPGGSSSGSGCIVAAGGAPFATGSDLGGSLRIPAHNHGICTIRPTANRLSDKGVVQCMPELATQPGVPGIIAPDAEILSLVWRAITENSIQNRFDPMAVPIPWNESLFSSAEKLKIGYYTSLPFFPAFEDTQKTVLAAKRALESKGHKLVEFEMPDDSHYLKVICNGFQGDHGRYLLGAFDGEPISDCVAGLVGAIRKAKLDELNGSDNSGDDGMTEREKIAFGAWGANVKTAGDLWDNINEKRLITQDILARMEKAGVDLLLSPAFPLPAVKATDGSKILSATVYTMIWNFVNFPAGVVRFGTETGLNVESYDDQNEPGFKAAKEALSESAGMPINVQIIGTPFKEEHVLRALVELEKLWKESKQ